MRSYRDADLRMILMGAPVNLVLRHASQLLRVGCLSMLLLPCAVLTNQLVPAQAVAQQVSTRRPQHFTRVQFPSDKQPLPISRRRHSIGYSFGDSPANSAQFKAQQSSHRSQLTPARPSTSSHNELQRIPQRQIVNNGHLGNRPRHAYAGFWQEPESDTKQKDAGTELELNFGSDDLDEAQPQTPIDEETLEDETTQSDDDYRLPRLANVKDPIGLTPLMQVQQEDPSGLLAQSEANYSQQANQLSYAELFNKPIIQSTARWTAPNFYHRPLLFEDVNLERYGNQTRYQNITSAAKFFGTIPTLPYRVGQNPRCHRDYTFKHYRPGDCVPYQASHFELNHRGGFWQTLATAALIIP